MGLQDAIREFRERGRHIYLFPEEHSRAALDFASNPDSSLPFDDMIDSLDLAIRILMKTGSRDSNALGNITDESSRLINSEEGDNYDRFRLHSTKGKSLYGRFLAGPGVNVNLANLAVDNFLTAASIGSQDQVAHVNQFYFAIKVAEGIANTKKSGQLSLVEEMYMKIEGDLDAISPAKKQLVNQALSEFASRIYGHSWNTDWAIRGIRRKGENVLSGSHGKNTQWELLKAADWARSLQEAYRNTADQNDELYRLELEFIEQLDDIISFHGMGTLALKETQIQTRLRGIREKLGIKLEEVVEEPESEVTELSSEQAYRATPKEPELNIYEQRDRARERLNHLSNDGQAVRLTKEYFGLEIECYRESRDGEQLARAIDNAHTLMDIWVEGQLEDRMGLHLDLAVQSAALWYIGGSSDDELRNRARDFYRVVIDGLKGETNGDLREMRETAQASLSSLFI